MREICLVDSDGNALGRVGKLRGGVDDAAVVLFPVAGRQDEQAVGCLLYTSLKDTCKRVGGDPTRKLGAADRLIGSSLLCLEQGVKPAY